MVKGETVTSTCPIDTGQKVWKSLNACVLLPSHTVAMLVTRALSLQEHGGEEGGGGSRMVQRTYAIYSPVIFLKTARKGMRPLVFYSPLQFPRAGADAEKTHARTQTN